MFPSLPKIRLSEFVVSFAPTTSGLWVIPAMYSVALQNGQPARASYACGYAHVIVKSGKGRVEVRDIQLAGGVVQHRHDVRERQVLHAAECVADGAG